MTVLRTFFTVVAVATLVSAGPSLLTTALNNNKCLTVQGNVNKNGTPVTISDCTGAAGQEWTQVPVGNSNVNGQLRIDAWNKCLDVKDGVNKNGQQFQIWDCDNNNPNQIFSAGVVDSSDSTLVWVGKNKCLDVTDGKLTNGNIVQIWDCMAGDKNQFWLGLGKDDTTMITILNHDDKCFTGSQKNGDHVTIQDCVSGSPSQQWTIPDVGVSGTISQEYTVAGSNPPETVKVCLDVTGGSTMDGTQMQVWTCATGNTNQKYTVQNNGMIAWTGRTGCLDLTDGVLTNGNIVQMFTCMTNGDNNQIWNTC